MIRAIRPNAMAQDDAAMVAGWNVAPNLAYILRLLPGASSCGVLLYDADNVLIATGAALSGAEKPCILTPQTGQIVNMVDAELGWHLLLTTVGTESQRTIRIGRAVDLPDEIHPIYGDDDMALARATAAIDDAAHYRENVDVSCPLGLGAVLGDVVSLPVDGVAVVGQVESITWTATPGGTTEQGVIRRHVAIAPESFVEPTLPTVSDDTGTATHLVGTSGNLLANDEAGLTVVAVNGLASNVGVAVDGNNGGSFTVAANGAWTFSPDGDFALLSGSETAETSVSYYASDGTAEATATVTVTVSHQNAVPVAVDDTGTTASNATTSGNVLTNDTDADGGTLAVSKVSGSAANIGVAVAGSGGGLFTIGSDGAWAFDPNGDFASLSGSETAATAVTYHVSDGVDEDEATLTVTVSAASAPNIEVVGSAIGSSTGATISLTLPTGIQAGDVCLLIGAAAVSSAAYSSFFTATDFTLIGGSTGNDTYDIVFVARYKVMDGGETTLDVTVGMSRAACVAAYVLRGVNQSSIFDVDSVFASGINSGIADSPAITTITDGSLVVIGGASADNYSAPRTISAPDGFDNFVRTKQTATSYSSITLGVASAIHDAGTIDQDEWGGLNSSTSCSWAAVTIALRPA